MLIRILLSILLLLTMWPSVGSQGLSLRHITQTSGLPNNYITALYKDSRGFLWIGSSAGLFRYDGYSARRVADMVGKDTGVLTEQIIAIQEDSKGRLWVQSESSHAIYDPQTNTLIDYTADYLKQFGVSSYITAVHADGNGDIWIATDRDGIYRLIIKEDRIEKASGDLPDSSVCSLTTYDGKILATTRSADLLETDPTTMKSRLLAKSPYPPKTIPLHHRIYADRSGRLWLANNERILMYNLGKGEWQTSLLPADGNVGVVKEIYHDSKGNLWIARDHHGIERLQFADETYRIVPVDTEGEFNPQTTVSAIIEDENGTLLFGTYKMGLYSFDESVNKFNHTRFPDDAAMPDVNCMLPAPDGEVWTGTDSYGLWKWNPATDASRRIPDTTPDAGRAITCIAQSPEGDILIGKFAKGLFSYRDGHVGSLPTGTDIDRSYVWSMDFDRNGVLWIGTLGNGVFRYDSRRNVTENFTSTNSALKTDFITSILCSADNKTYIGTSGGVSCFDPADGKISRVSIDSVPSISESKVIQLFEDSRGLLWIASTAGLKVLDRKRGKVYSIQTGEAPHATDVLGMAEDRNGSIWLSNSSSRLTWLKVEYDEADGELHVSRREYDRHSGLQDCDFNQRSFARLNDGSIAVGGPYGITWFNPTDIRMNVNRPKALLTDLYMDGHPVNPGEKIDGRVAITDAIFTGGRIEFNHNPKEFTIFFASDNYALPEKTRFRYRLMGYSDQWTECPVGVNHASYTNLSPGDYRLEVVAINEDGFESEYPATVDIRVHHSFWGSPWAWLIYALLGAGCIWLITFIVRKRERNLLEQRNQEENLRKQEELNQMKFRFFTNVSHDLRTPLSLIVSPLEDMIKESTDERQTKRLNLMRNNALRLLSLVNQLLDFRKSEQTSLHLNPSEGDIVTFTRNVCASFLSLSDRKDINLTFYSDQERIDLLFDPDKMEKILMNLLGNAFKFTPAGGRIDIAIDHCGEDRQSLRIQVSDTGIGIKDKDKKRIFERFYQVNDDGDSHPGTGSGIGLSMVSEYVSLHNGTIRVADNVERGSVFIIEMPIRHASIQEATTSETFIPEKTDDQPKEQEAGNERPTVLIVDDNPDMTEMLRDSLDNIYRIETASDGKEALEKAKEIKPDIILTDLMMPVMNGMELCRALKEDEETVNIPIIIITAKHDLGVKLEGLTIGADDYITKPFNLDVLRLRMRRLIELNAKGARRSLIEPEPEKIDITPLDEKLIEKAMKYVSQNLSRPELSVEELSEHLGMSRVSLYKKIKQITGKSPIEFIRIIRLKRAAQLLRESQLNVSEIAYQTGFNNPKAFSKYFKDEFGILPSLYQDKEGTETNYTL